MTPDQTPETDPSSVMPRPKPDAEKVRRQILESAMRLLQSQAFAQLTMRDLAQDAGMAVGRIYHFFPSRDALFLELEIAFFQGVVSSFPMATLATVTPAVRLLAMAQHYYQYACENLSLYRLVTSPPKVYSDYLETPEHQVASHELTAALVAVGLIRHMVADALGIKSQDHPLVQERTLFFINCMHGLILNRHSPILPYVTRTPDALAASGYQEPDSESLAGRQLDHIVRSVLLPSSVAG